MAEDNPDYISVSKLLGVYHVNKHSWNNRQDCYQIVISKRAQEKGAAWVMAQEWAKREGIEVR